MLQANFALCYVLISMLGPTHGGLGTVAATGSRELEGRS